MVATYFATFASLVAAVAAGSCGNNTERAPTAHLQVLSYNDVYEMKPEEDATQYGVLVGGPSRVVPIAKKLRQTYENSLVIFAGDTMSPSLWSGQFKGLQMIEAHNALGVDFACLGNHEFDFGIDAFLNVSAASKFPWLNANAYEVETKKLLRGTKPNAVKTLNSTTMGTVKIGAFGVMYDMKDSSKGMYWTDPIAAAKEQVKYLREVEKVDMVIALTHQFLDDDNVFSQQVKGVDIIYGGHDHAAMLQSNFGPAYLKSDLNFRSVWISDIKYYAKTTDKSNKTMTAFTKMSHKNLQITGGMPSDPRLDEIIASYDAKISVLFLRKVGSLCADTDLRKSLVRFAEAPIGNFFADAFQAYYQKKTVDASVMNGGGIRTDKLWPAGALTLGDLISWSPFGDSIVVISTDGASLKKFLTFKMVDSCGEKQVAENGHYFHMAGMKYTFKCSAKGAGSITSIEWDGKLRTGAVKDDDKLNLALSTYMKGLFDQAGGKATFVVDPNESTRIEAILEKHIETVGGSVCSVLEGRSTVIPPTPTP
ncbi:calcineurin-like phosphoesterase [Achlya hypogyna]|uniref:Calcineurin-like phosphoesterase n=1 Tax=Achlya hypogyna TaxID=1202772 RepID=A0A0A7CPJ5_ACHHY|nr:secreted protein [Achlya hypogyna]OQR82979.1 calcineurin-like phosphoesterase [Achlya hypogyna]